METRHTKQFIILTAFIACNASVVFSQTAYPDYSNQHIKNSAGAPLGLINIAGSDGQTVATLYITGKDAYFGPNQVLTKGSGYIQSIPDNFFRILPVVRYKKNGEAKELFHQVALYVRRIEWDDNGMTTHIVGIKPEMDTDDGEKMHITSDVQNPTLNAGLLLLEIKELGKVSAEMQFGGLQSSRLVVETDLTWPVCKSDVHSVKALLAAGANKEATNSDGDTALMKAAETGNLDCTKALIGAGANKEARDSNGMTPLIAATYADFKDVVGLLVANKADVNAQDKTGGTPLLWAVFKGDKEMVRLLLANGANVNVKMKDGMTPLHLAASGNADLVELLVTNKANVNAKSNDGTTPLGLAIKYGKNDVAELLRQHGGLE
ncbi:MAG: ankyrin repeat domain-containing protein [Verrucomicrobiia bacterium]